ncbi:hypothetical protein OAD28_00175 [Flavobacteriales bacterium]|nr:hypothetical protein [Flavobacteriales bacterium]
MTNIFIKLIIKVTVLTCLLTNHGLSQEYLTPSSQKKKSRIIQRAIKEIEKGNIPEVIEICDKYQQSKLNLDTNDLDFLYVKGRMYLGMFLTAKPVDKEILLYQSADILSKINCNNFSSQQLLDLNLYQISCKKFFFVRLNLKITEGLIEYGRRDNHTMQLALNLPCVKTQNLLDTINFSLGEKEYNELTINNHISLSTLREINKKYPRFSKSKVYQNKFQFQLNDSISKARIRLEKEYKEASSSLFLLRVFKNKNPKYFSDNELVKKTYIKLFQDSVVETIKLNNEFKEASSSLFLLRVFKNKNPKYFSDNELVKKTYIKLFQDSVVEMTKKLNNEFKKVSKSLSLLRVFKNKYSKYASNNKLVLETFDRLYQDSVNEKLLAIRKLETIKKRRKLEELLKLTSFDYRKGKYSYTSNQLENGLRKVIYQDKDLNIIGRDVFKDDLLISSYNYNRDGVLNGPFFDRIKLNSYQYFDISNKEKPRMGLLKYNGEYCEMSNISKNLLVSKGYYQNGVLSSNKFIIKIDKVDGDYDWTFDGVENNCNSEKYPEVSAIVAICSIYDGKIEGDLEYYFYSENKRNKDYSQYYPILNYDYTAVQYIQTGPIIRFENGVVEDGWVYIGKGKSYLFKNGEIIGYKKYYNNSISGPISDSMVVTEDIWMVDGVLVKRVEQVPWVIENSKTYYGLDSFHVQSEGNDGQYKFNTNSFNLYVKSYLASEKGIPKFHKMDIETCNESKVIENDLRYIINNLKNISMEDNNRGYTEKEIKSKFESNNEWRNASNCSYSWFTQEIGDRGIIDNGIYQFPIMNYSTEFVFIHRE